MQVLFDNIKSDGELALQIDCLDDLWVLYNIIKPGDRIKGRTVRRVIMREGDPGERKPMTLLLDVEKVEFHEFSNRLRVSGTIMEGPSDWVSLGQHHTFNLEPGNKIRIFKDEWYRNDVMRIKRNLDKKENDLMLCIAIESGIANVAILSHYSLTPISEINHNIPGKRYKKQEHKQAMEHFFQSVSEVVVDNVTRNFIKLIVVCGPGFFKEEYIEYFNEKNKQECPDVDLRALNASSGELSAIYETLRDGSIATQKKDFKLAQDEMLMSKFVEGLGKDEGKVVYGIDEVLMAAQAGAVEELLITDLLMRTSAKDNRKLIEDALNYTEQQRGIVHILSTINPAGEQLEKYGNIAGILRYRLSYD